IMTENFVVDRSSSFMKKVTEQSYKAPKEETVGELERRFLNEWSSSPKEPVREL
ncbi:hypothetical protein AVEN_125910-1, partial [Araneus ventricosus]